MKNSLFRLDHPCCRQSPRIIFSSVSTACFEMVLQSPHPLLDLRPAECVIGSAGTLTAGRYSKASVSLSLVCVSYHQHGTGKKPFRPPYREYRRSLVCARSPERLSVSASLAVRFAQLRPDSRRKPSQNLFSRYLQLLTLPAHSDLLGR